MAAAQTGSPHTECGPALPAARMARTSRAAFGTTPVTSTGAYPWDFRRACALSGLPGPGIEPRPPAPQQPSLRSFCPPSHPVGSTDLHHRQQHRRLGTSREAASPPLRRPHCTDIKNLKLPTKLWARIEDYSFNGYVDLMSSTHARRGGAPRDRWRPNAATGLGSGACGLCREKDKYDKKEVG